MSFDNTETTDRSRTPGSHLDGYVLGPDEGSHTWFDGGLITYKAKAADTRGDLSFFQCDVPHGWQSPVHRHNNESELFLITEGEWEIYVNETVHEVTPGSTVWIPKGAAHSIFVKSRRARGFCVVTPGGFERFFEDLGEPATIPSMPTHETRKPTVAELQAGGASVGWELVEPAPRRLS